MDNKINKYIFCFLICLLWFFFQFNHYENIVLKFKLKDYPFGPEDKIVLTWDSGHDYNLYERIELDLYKPEALREINLPGLDIKKVKFDVKSGDKKLNQIIDKLEFSTESEKKEIDRFGTVSSKEVLKAELPKAKTFSLFLLVFQITLALILAYFYYLLSIFFKKQGGVRRFFSGKDERNFLITTLALFAIYSIWVVGLWPIAMTNDSWSSLGDVRSLKFSDWHPYFYAFYILSLLNIYDGLQTVSLFQAMFSAVTISYGFYFCAKQGIKWKYLFPFIIFAACSIPIACYNAMMWKDVPYSQVILLLSILFFKYLFLLKTKQQKYKIEGIEFFILLYTCLGVIFFRHNGIIYLPFLPILFFVLFDKTSFRKAALCLLLFFGLFKVVLPKTLDIKKPAGAPYQQMKLTLAIMTHPAFFSPTRDEDIKVIEDATKHSFETLKNNYPQRWFWLWDNSEVARNQWSATGGQTESYNSAFLVKLIYYNLPIFLAEQTYGFFHSIGIDYNQCDKYNGFYEDPLQIFGTNLADPGRHMWGLVVRSNSPFPEFKTKVNQLITWSTTFNGMLSPMFFIWGLLIVFILLFLILFLENPFSPISLYVTCHLLSAAFVFMIGAGESWRYFYNIYLSSILLLPFWFLSRNSNR